MKDIEDINEQQDNYLYTQQDMDMQEMGQTIESQNALIEIIGYLIIGFIVGIVIGIMNGWL